MSALSNADHALLTGRASMTETPNDTRLEIADIVSAVSHGYAVFAAIPGVSIAYAAVFAMPGLVMLVAVSALGLSPLALPFAGGFMLVGPILLTGYFELARLHSAGDRPRLGGAFNAFRTASSELWLLALLCAFLFLIWITDAGVLYSFTIGSLDMPAELGWLPHRREDTLKFTLWGSVMGSIIAYMIFTVSAFAVPLIYDRRASLVRAISMSARTVLSNFLVCIAWGIILGVVIVASILLLPLLLVSLPIMSYASYALYQRALPPSVAQSPAAHKLKLV